MASTDNQTASANVLTITRPTPSRQVSSNGALPSIEDVESTHSLTPTHTTQNEKFDREESPFSPFYNPSPTRHSLDKAKSESTRNINIITTPYDTDIEAQSLAPQKTTNTCGGKISLLKSKSRGDLECQMWPGHSELKKKKKAMRKARGEDLICCGCMAGLDNKTKIWIKLLIILVIIGAVIGVSVGMTKAVGGGVFKSSHNPSAPLVGR